MPAGRPTDYRPEFCERVIELGRIGYSHAQIAAELGFARQTLYDWAAAHPDFKAAIVWAHDLSQAWFEHKGMRGMEAPGFNAVLWSKQMQCRFQDEYMDKSKREITGKDGGPIETKSEVTVRPSVSREEWLKLHGLDTPAGSATSSS